MTGLELDNIKENNVTNPLISGSSKRPLKGKYLRQLFDEYVVIDIETTGLDPYFDEIIEIAALKIKDGICVDQFQSLCKPMEEISEFISQLTGITNEDLSTAPDLDTVLKDFFPFVDGEILVGHNVNFDVNFLYDNIKDKLGYPLSNNYVDTMYLSRSLFQDKLKRYKLKYIAKEFNLLHQPSHRGLDDCFATFDLYEYIKNYVTKNGISLELPRIRNIGVRAKDITTAKTEFDINHPLYDKICVFTGTLEKMNRRDAMQLVLDYGGHCGDTVTKKTNYLILGNFDYCPNVKNGKSRKYQKAEKYKLDGCDIEIISENVFYDLLEDASSGYSSKK